MYGPVNDVRHGCSRSGEEVLMLHAEEMFPASTPEAWDLDSAVLAGLRAAEGEDSSQGRKQ